MSVAHESLDLLDGVTIHEQSSPESLRMRNTPRIPAVDQSIHCHPGTLDDDQQSYDVADAGHGQESSDAAPRPYCSSSRSSISSFPASVIHNVPITDIEDEDVPSKSSRPPIFRHHENNPIASNMTLQSREYVSPFRHPSSVLAMQMETDYSDSDVLSVTPSQTHHNSPRKSPRVPQFDSRRYSPASGFSQSLSPIKRSSRPGTPSQLRGSQRNSSRLKKEFPLVLLHCTVLEPSLTERGTTVPHDILEAVLPSPYNKRWRTLQDKVHQNGEIKQRGVLVPHPRDDYDLLEERLLETLELQRPRVRQSHYLGEDAGGEIDSGFESAGSQRSDDDNYKDEDQAELCTHKCPDCGKAISVDTELERKYEIKIYAANGLMKGGAWAAAWSEMEKIDIDISVWMPEEVRREVEARLAALEAKAAEPKPDSETVAGNPKSRRQKVSKTQSRRNARTREIYGQELNSPTSSGPIPQAQVETLEEQTGEVDSSLPQSFQPPLRHTKVSFDEPPTTQVFHVEQQPQFQSQYQHLQRLVPIWCRIAIQDRRNVAIIILSVIVIFFSLSQPRAKEITPTPPNSRPTSLSLSTSEADAPHRAGFLESGSGHPYTTTAVTSAAVADTAEVLVNFESPSTVTETSSKTTSLTEGAVSVVEPELEVLADIWNSNTMLDGQYESDDKPSENDAIEEKSEAGNLRAIEHKDSKDNTDTDAALEISQEQVHAPGNDVTYIELIDLPVESAGSGGVSEPYKISEGLCDI